MVHKGVFECVRRGNVLLTAAMGRDCARPSKAGSGTQGSDNDIGHHRRPHYLSQSSHRFR